MMFIFSDFQFEDQKAIRKKEQAKLDKVMVDLEIMAKNEAMNPFFRFGIMYAAESIRKALDPKGYYP